MASKQQSSHQSQNSSAASSQSTTRSLIVSNVYFDGKPEKLLRGLRFNYKGVEDLVPLYFQDNNGRRIRAIRIDVKLDNLAQQFLDESEIHIDDKVYPIQSSTRSIVVSKVASSENEAKFLQDLAHNYLGVEKISQFYHADGQAVDDIRIDFKSDSVPMKIIKDNYIIIDGKRRPVQPYWSFINVPSQNQNGKNHASEQPQTSSAKQPQKPAAKQPQKYLTEQRLKELFREQQMQLEAMINEFENKWNARLSSSKTASTNTDVDQLVPIIKDLSMVCQQFNQQNAQIQRQLGSVVHRVQDVQVKLNNEQEQNEWPQLPIQNGH